ncbi:C39 family peptidase [Solwaraspora sp. WMMD1047]|uniref:C39 family peptidase n=1 Tax=Solwaraspora sp. WMMD1047 TaxID=3016102 RepID=UPI00241597A1|nr:C39 family peptidase [Solwaraspora sp. WMMD1047]MDG4827909.1 C39 family peptidase [Solwaraspora sp. WMMD1047]
MVRAPVGVWVVVHPRMEGVGLMTVFQTEKRFGVVARRAVLGVAGLAFAGGIVAAPVAAQAAPERPPVVASAQQRDAGVKEVRYEYRKQENYYYCGPAATRIALTAAGAAPSQDEVAKLLGTTEAGTNSAEDVTRVLNGGGAGRDDDRDRDRGDDRDRGRDRGDRDRDRGRDERRGDRHRDGRGVYKTVTVEGPSASAAATERLSADVVAAVDAGRAVVANIKGTATDVDGGVHAYEGGHYLTIVGYRDGGGVVKIADPYDPVGEYWVTADEMADWMADRGYSA